MTSEHSKESNLESILSENQNDEQTLSQNDPNSLHYFDIDEEIDSLKESFEVDSLKESIEVGSNDLFEIENNSLSSQKDKKATPKASFNQYYDDDSYLILTASQSEERIILLLVICSLLFSLAVLTYLTHFALILNTERPKVVQPNLKHYMQGKYLCYNPYDCFIVHLIFITVGFPIPYLGILEPNGAFHTTMTPLLDVISTKNISLKKLPNPGLFGDGPFGKAIIHPFVYQDFIYFIYANPLKQNVRFDIEQNNHKTLAKSYIPDTQTWMPKAVRIGHTVWVMGGKYFSKNEWNQGDAGLIHTHIQNHHNPLTSLWSFKREKWYSGPNFKEHLDLFENPKNLNLDYTCLVTLNQSTVFLISCDYYEQFTLSFDFVTKSWQRHDKVTLSELKWPTNCAIFISKSHKRFILTLFSVGHIVGSQTELSIFDTTNYQWMKSFPLTSGLGLIQSFGSLFLISCHQISGETQLQYQAIELKKNEWVWKDPIIKNVDFILGNVSIINFQAVEFLQRNWK